MYKFLEHTADIGVKGYGKTIAEAFQETAKAMYSLMANIKKVKLRKEKIIKVKAKTLEELLYVFLNELIFITDTKNLLFTEFMIEIKERKNKKTGKELFLKARVKGEKINEKTHEIYSDVKAATYTGLRIGKEKGKFYAQCILDV